MLLLCVLCMGFIVPTPVFAVNATDIASDFNSLDISQKAEILTLIAEKTDENTNENTGIPIIGDVNPSVVSEWVQVGEDIGTAMITVASKLGVSGDELLKSTSGKITIGLIVYKVAYDDIIKVLSSSCLILFGIPLWLFYVNRFCTEPVLNKEYVYEKGKIVTNSEGNKISHFKVIGKRFTGDGIEFFSWLTGIMIVFVALLIIL